MFQITNVHRDWYEDGVEDGENLWRLDWPEYQAQLFCKLDHDDRKVVVNADGLRYVSARLLIERDRRDESGDNRIDYACEAWPISPEQAQELLRMDREGAKAAMAAKIAVVQGLPCDARYLK
jgi:hypothetical protein